MSDAIQQTQEQRELEVQNKLAQLADEQTKLAGMIEELSTVKKGEEKGEAKPRKTIKEILSNCKKSFKNNITKGCLAVRRTPEKVGNTAGKITRPFRNIRDGIKHGLSSMKTGFNKGINGAEDK